MGNQRVLPVGHHDNRRNGEVLQDGKHPLPRFVLPFGVLTVHEPLPAGAELVLLRNGTGGIEYVPAAVFFGTTAVDGAETPNFRMLLADRETRAPVAEVAAVAS